jgi:hypothetical protein
MHPRSLSLAFASLLSRIVPVHAESDGGGPGPAKPIAPLPPVIKNPSNVPRQRR